MQWVWNPADAGELKEANLELICLAVWTSKYVKKHLVLLRECGKHFQVSKTHWTWWQMGRVWAWHWRGHFITGCCSKPCGRQSKPICHKEIKLRLELPNQGARESLCLGLTPVWTPALPSSVTKSTKLSKRKPNLSSFYFSKWIRSTTRTLWLRGIFFILALLFIWIFIDKDWVFSYYQKLSSYK